MAECIKFPRCVAKTFEIKSKDCRDCDSFVFWRGFRLAPTAPDWQFSTVINKFMRTRRATTSQMIKIVGCFSFYVWLTMSPGMLLIDCVRSRRKLSERSEPPNIYVGSWSANGDEKQSIFFFQHSSLSRGDIEPQLIAKTTSDVFFSSSDPLQSREYWVEHRLFSLTTMAQF